MWAGVTWDSKGGHSHVLLTMDQHLGFGVSKLNEIILSLFQKGKIK